MPTPSIYVKYAPDEPSLHNSWGLELTPTKRTFLRLFYIMVPFSRGANQLEHALSSRSTWLPYSEKRLSKNPLVELSENDKNSFCHIRTTSILIIFFQTLTLLMGFFLIKKPLTLLLYKVLYTVTPATSFILSYIPHAFVI